MTTETTYRLLSLTCKGGMYSCGDEAATPELARLARGSLDVRPNEPLVIEQCRWTISTDGHRSLVSRVCFERVTRSDVMHGLGTEAEIEDAAEAAEAAENARIDAEVAVKMDAIALAEEASIEAL